VEAVRVPNAVVQLFQQLEQTGRTPTGMVIRYFEDKPLLLVLDDCEHVIAACAELVARTA
jgi:non-specific serine/threonine protein kinase